MVIDNLRDGGPTAAARLCILKDDPVGLIHFEQRWRGTFSDTFNIKGFPYDAQAVTLSLRVHSAQDQLLGRQAALLMEEPPIMSPAVNLSEWHIYDTRAEATVDGRGRPQYVLNVILRRKHE